MKEKKEMIRTKGIGAEKDLENLLPLAKEKQRIEDEKHLAEMEKMEMIGRPDPQLIPRGLTTRDLDSKTLQYKPERKKQ